jgi:hypothetical protein
MAVLPRRTTLRCADETGYREAADNFVIIAQFAANAADGG